MKKDDRNVVDVEDRMQFEAEIMGIKCEPTVDTGAQESVCNIKLAKKWQAKDPTLKLFDGKYITLGPFEDALKCCGKINKVPISIGGSTKEIIMLFFGNVMACIVGTHWLKKNKANLNMVDNVLIINSVNPH